MEGVVGDGDAGGGRGKVPVGGCYRLIDTPISNCINNGINKIFLPTQFNSDSLNCHLVWTYHGTRVNFGHGFEEVLAATQTAVDAGMKWFQGTADAVRQFTLVFEHIKGQLKNSVGFRFSSKLTEMYHAMKNAVGKVDLQDTTTRVVDPFGIFVGAYTVASNAPDDMLMVMKDQRTHVKEIRKLLDLAGFGQAENSPTHQGLLWLLFNLSKSYRI
ncbi:hypothetical protein Vadar_021682 [Vaccinium darrowii]|uniref:Uncharacterized protein n=1 Tax=Vaccinium darrowii TaxID=229202 RepID=A0ACB7XBS7_9ERIC|nr:hypothetical protein Vadar_021682 [Vaccinium darrowii]